MKYMKNIQNIMSQILNRRSNNNTSLNERRIDSNDNISFDCVYSIKSSDSERSFHFLSSPKYRNRNDMRLISVSSEDTITSSENEEDLCSICLEELKESKSLSMSQCQHKFHVKCVKQWLNEKATCPLCNSDQEKLKNRLSF